MGNPFELDRRIKSKKQEVNGLWNEIRDLAKKADRGEIDRADYMDDRMSIHRKINRLEGEISSLKRQFAMALAMQGR